GHRNEVAMAKKVLQVLESAFRCNIEEQDDPVLWVTHAMRGAGAGLDLLLRGNAVGYAVAAQDASGLTFGERRQTQPPRIAEDVTKLVEKGAQVFLVEDDAAERGLERSDFVPGVKTVSRSGLPAL